MSRLLDLPAELLSDIAEWVGAGEPQTYRNLLALCRCCRRLTAATQPILFRTFRMGSFSTEIEPTRRLIRFTNTIAERRDLAEAVRVVETDFKVGPDHYDISKMADEIEHHASILKVFPDMEAEDFNVKAAILPYPHIRMLLAFTSNIQELKVVMWNGHQGDFEDFLDLAPENFQTLTKLSLTCREADLPEDLPLVEPISPLLQLPRLREYNLVRFMTNECHVSPVNVPSRSLNITHLSLVDCVVDDSDFLIIMEAAKSLKQVRFKAFDNIGGESDYLHDPVVWFHALAKHKTTLEDIGIDFSDIWNPFAGDMTQTQWPSFSQFPVLRHLRLEYHRMPGFHQLPPGLDKLEMTDCREELKEAEVPIWTELKNKFCPNIKQVIVYAGEGNWELKPIITKNGFVWLDIDELSLEWRPARKQGWSLQVVLPSQTCPESSLWDSDSENEYDDFYDMDVELFAEDDHDHEDEDSWETDDDDDDGGGGDGECDDSNREIERDDESEDEEEKEERARKEGRQQRRRAARLVFRDLPIRGQPGASCLRELEEWTLAERANNPGRFE